MLYSVQKDHLLFLNKTISAAIQNHCNRNEVHEKNNDMRRNKIRNGIKKRAKATAVRLF